MVMAVLMVWNVVVCEEAVGRSVGRGGCLDLVLFRLQDDPRVPCATSRVVRPYGRSELMENRPREY